MGAATLSRSGTAAPVNIFNDFIRSSTIPGSIIVELTAFPRGASPLGGRFPPTMGWATMGRQAPEGSVAPGAITLRLSADGVRFGPTDPISPGYKTEGRLASKVNVRSSIEVTPDLTSAAVISVGDIEVLDQDRVFEEYVEGYSWPGRKVVIKWGPRGETLANYRTIVETYAKDWLRSDSGTYRLRLQDLQFTLQRAFQTREFGGTGGLEGDSNVVGRLKPRLLGHRPNFIPVLFDTANRYWMYNDGPAAGLVEARYGGEPVEIVDTVDNLFDFATYELGEGEVLDCPALGICRDRPAGGISAPFTVEARGDSTGGYSALIGDLIAKVFAQFAGFDLTQYDAPSLAAFNIGEGSYWFDGASAVTLRTVVERLALDAGGKLAPGAKFSALPLRDPDDDAFDFEIKETAIANIARRGRQSKPVVDVIVRWKPNDRALTDAEILVPGDNADLKAYLKKAFETTTPQPDGRVLFEELDFQESVTLTTSLITPGGVSQLLTRFRNFFSKERTIWDVEVNTREALLYPIGSIVRIYHRGRPWSGGKNALVVKNDANFDTQKPTLRVLV